MLPSGRVPSPRTGSFSLGGRALNGIRQLWASYPELLVVALAAVVGLSVQPPLAWLVRHHGIDVVLAILVYATAWTIEPRALIRLPAAGWRLAAALVTGALVLPALSWGVSQLVTSGPLRDGVMTVGLAPCEIASVAITAMAAGDAALSAAILAGTTVVAIALAGPILHLEAGHGSVDVSGIAGTLALVVAAPLAVGLVLRPRPSSAERVGGPTATGAVAVLVAMIAAEVHLRLSYLAVFGALLVFLAASAVVGTLLGRAAAAPVARSLLLTTSMRDFAIAAAIANAAFGASAAAPLGIYGILVMVWGTATAGRLRRHPAVPS